MESDGSNGERREGSASRTAKVDVVYPPSVSMPYSPHHLRSPAEAVNHDILIHDMSVIGMPNNDTVVVVHSIMFNEHLQIRIHRRRHRIIRLRGDIFRGAK